MSRFVAIPALALCLLAAVLFTMSLLRDRDLVAATPSPRPLFDVTPIAIEPRTPLCLQDVTIPADARQVRFQVITGGPPGPALTIALRADGYGQRLTVPGGYADAATVAERMDPPPVARLGEVCVVNEGTAPIELTGTAEVRTQSRPRGEIEGRPVTADTYLAFYEGETGSALSRMGAIVDRMDAFRPGIVGPWLLWPLLVLVVFGVPAAVIWALHRASQPT